MKRSFDDQINEINELIGKNTAMFFDLKYTIGLRIGTESVLFKNREEL